MVANNGSVCVTKNKHNSAQSVQNHMLYTEMFVMTMRFFCHAGNVVCETLLIPHGVDVTKWDIVVRHSQLKQTSN